MTGHRSHLLCKGTCSKVQLGVVGEEVMSGTLGLEIIMDLYHVSRFLSSGSHHSWVNLKSSEWESTTNIYFFAFPFYSNSKIKTLR